MRNACLLLFGLLSVGIETIKAQYTVLLNFDDTNGANPCGSLTYSGNNLLYGMTPIGGVYKYGFIFSIDINGNNYKDLFDFDGINGEDPQGSLILSGSTLYGITNGGGTLGYGTIFSVDTTGKGYKVLHNFNDTAGEMSISLGSLVLSGGVLYGMTEAGGKYNDGCIFSINTDGSNYKDILDFNGTNGYEPFGSLAVSGNKLYGMTSRGGANSFGLIFSIDINGKGYIDIWNFDDTGSNGETPQGSLIVSGNKLYGMTMAGGNDAQGNIFSIDTDGTGYINLLSLNNQPYGQWPTGDLLLLGNTLYGMAGFGTYGRSQKNDSGYIFSINTDGTGFTDLYNFNLRGGYAPRGSLIAVGNSLYGMTEFGGKYSDGVIFSISDKGTGIDKLIIPTGLISVYPNPSNGTFNLSLSNVNTAYNIEIYNVLGEKVYSESLPQSQNNNTINLTAQPSGVYLYRVITESEELVGEGKVIYNAK
jgi:uncharacterized repeat protein (TIGR03803 family)